MTNDSFTIRLATTKDIQRIAEFNRALCWETENHELNPETVRKGVSNFIAHPKRGRYYVAEGSNGLIGQSAYTYEWSDWRNGELWWIQSVYVEPGHRGKGVFRALYEHIRRLAESDPHCCGIRLYMERDNHTARRSYHKLGFEETGYEVLEALL